MKDKIRLFPAICGECGSAPGEPCRTFERDVAPSQRLPTATVHQTRINRTAMLLARGVTRWMTRAVVGQPDGKERR